MSDISAISQLGLDPLAGSSPLLPSVRNAAAIGSASFERMLSGSAQDASGGGAGDTQSAKAAQAFEVMVVATLLNDAFQSAGSSAFGEGFQGDFFGQVFTEAVAERIVAGGGLGIAAMVDKR